MEKIQKKLSDNIAWFQEKLSIEDNFDIILREIEIGSKKAALIFVDGFADDSVATLTLKTLLETTKDKIIPNTVEKIVRSHIPYIEVEVMEDPDEIVDKILSGAMLLMIDGEKEAVIIDARTYPARTPEEPDIERVTRGSRDGFVETLLFNVTLVRRRLRDPNLTVEAMKVGTRSSTDIAMLYIKDITNPELVENIRKRIEKVEIDALPMAEKTLEEYIRGSYWNPFPEVRYTERPDVATVHLLEGHVVIMVDTSPSVIIAPTTLFHHMQHAEEYRHDPVIGLYIRWVRFVGILFSFILVPLWLLLVLEPGLLPPALDFIGTEEDFKIPLMLQFVFAHIGIDLLRLASIHTPSPLAVALGLVGALLIGQIAVDVGFFVPEVLLYMGLVAVGIFSTPSWELSMANRLVLLFLILMTGFFKLPGLIIGLIIVFIRLVTTKSFGYPYMYPLWPFNIGDLISIFFRKPIPESRLRPKLLKTTDKDRQK